MVSKKIALSLCLVLVLASGCSRQQSDWQKTRETNTTDAYESFLKKYPTGEFAAQAQARVKELYEVRDWQKARDTDTPEAYQAFVKQYPDGKSAEEARIRIENFSLAQVPGSSTGAADGAMASNSTPENNAAPPSDDGAPPAAAPRASTPALAHAASAAQPAKASKPPVAVSSKARANGGDYGVQLGAFKTDRSAADQRWARLQKDYPKVLAGLSSTVLPKQTATGNWYRLQAVGMSEKHARSICDSLKAQSQACVVVRPTSG